MNRLEQLSTEERLQSLLRSSGISIPTLPHGQKFPLEILARGDFNEKHLTGKEQLFTPHPGQMGTWGIFLADVLSAVVDADILYVFQTQKVLQTTGANQWLSYNENNSRDLLAKISSLKHLNVTTLDGGIEAEEELFKENPIYQPLLGIATIPNPLPVSHAYRIFVKNSVLETIQGNIHRSLTNKIVGY